MNYVKNFVALTYVDSPFNLKKRFNILGPINFLIWLLLVGHSIGFSQDARLIAKTVFPSVVMLEMRDEMNRPIKLGSGFFVRPDVIVTNYHVIEGAADGFANIVGSPTISQIDGVVGIDKTKDLASLKVKGLNGKPLILADVSKIEVGQEVFALGNPKGLEGTISPGIISGNRLRNVENEYLIQITSPISPGSSGGPVVNQKGEVIGVAVGSFKDGQNLNFAIPTPYLTLLLANSKDTVSLAQVNRTGGQKSVSSNQRSVSPGPTLSETSKWIVETLSGRGGGDAGTFWKNESITIDDCTMIFTQTTRIPGSSYQQSYQQIETYIAPLNKIEFIEPRLFDRWMSVHFHKQAVQVKVAIKYADRDGFETFHRNDDYLSVFTGDAEMGARAGRAFARIKELCEEPKKKEPF